MKRAHSLILIGPLCLAGSILLYFACSQASEPKYQSRTLTSYLEGPWKQIDGPQTENPHFAPDEKAIRVIGTNGIPTLLRLIEAQDPAWRQKWYALLKRQSVVHFEIRDATRKRELGCLRFHILGNIAKPAVPKLVQLLNHPAFEVRAAATNCLREIKPDIF